MPHFADKATPLVIPDKPIKPLFKHLWAKGQARKTDEADPTPAMNLIADLLAPLALLVPALAGHDVQPVENARLSAQEAEVEASANVVAGGANIAGPSYLDAYLAVYRDMGPTLNQVRIERRVIVRITPSPNPIRQNLMAELPRRSAQPRFMERPFGDCLPVSSIAGVQADRGNRLLLFLRDRRLVLANLEKSCSSRDFYSGFYLESSDDGRLCVDRDKLMSRSGAKCELSSMTRLVPVGS